MINSKGFTLVEILVVIAIIGISAATLVPTLNRYLPGIQLNGSVRTLTSNLREAQEKAVAEQKQYTIQFYPTAVPPYYEMTSEGVTIKSITLSNGETMALTAGITGNKITFSSDGGPSSSGNITLSIEGVSKIINIFPSGFIKNP